MKYEITSILYLNMRIIVKIWFSPFNKKSLKYVLVQLVRKLLEDKLEQQLIKFVHRKEIFDL